MQKQIYLIAFAIILLLTTAVATTASLDELISSYNFDYQSEALNILNQNDYMLDTNANGINDKLFFNLSIDINTEGTYQFIIDIENKNSIVSTQSVETLNTNSEAVVLNISTEFLTDSQFNYSIKIYNENNTLVFRKFGIKTNNYSDYEANFEILEISDENINNNSVRINLVIDSNREESKNVTIYLKYNNSFIKESKEIEFISGENDFYLDFADAKIKNTHYNGNYIPDKIKIGGKIIQSNYTTANYNFENFAKTSYFKSYSDQAVDIDGDNLADYLKINFILNVKYSGIYTLESQLFDEFNNFIVSMSLSKYLNPGINTLEVFINGSQIYQSGIDSPYLIKFANLINSSANLVDEVIQPYTLTTANLSHADFERPALPDLEINMNVYSDEINNFINVTVQNIGNAPAFNVFVDIFDSKSYEAQDSYSTLGVNEIQNFNFIISDEQLENEFIAIVDFANLIDESNETNNIVYYYLNGSLSLNDSANHSNENNIMTVSVSLLNFADFIGIEVSDFIFFGNITRDNPVSDRIKIYLNNTGNMAISVTPELANSSDNIFRNIYFQKTTTSDYFQIGSYTHNISKPDSGDIKSGHFYATLDLSDLEQIEHLINHRGEIRFYALQQ